MTACNPLGMAEGRTSVDMKLCGIIWLGGGGVGVSGYCTLKLSYGHDCIHLEKFSLLALVLTGLLQSQGKIFWSA